MGCKHYHKLLHLHRPGELSPRQTSKLKKHLAGCTSCRELRVEIERTARLTGLAKDRLPRLQSNPGMTDDIIAVLAREERFSPAVRTGKAWEKPRHQPVLSRTGFALAAAASLFLAFFLMQEFFVLYRVSKLEQRMTRQSRALTLSRAGHFPGGVDSILEVYLEEEGETKWDRLVKDRDSLEAWRKAYKRLRRENTFLLNVLRERLPGLQGLSLENGLDEHEIRTIIKNKERILEYIQKI